MFMQIHMLQSMPPGNLNRDDTGQPKKCIFGNVTRGRISSQCLKRNIRRSACFETEFEGGLSTRTKCLPRMVADALKELNTGFTEDDLNGIMAAVGRKFKKEKGEESDAQESGGDKGAENTDSSTSNDQTGQLVFFPPAFAKEIAELIIELKNGQPDAYSFWIHGGKRSGKTSKKKTPEKDNTKDQPVEDTKALGKIIDKFETHICEKSKSFTVDIGLFGRMTTNNLVVNVEAACQVAHAIATHETVIEGDYFTAMDDEKSGQAAGFVGRDDKVTYFDSAVYYKYLNLDVDALKKHLAWDDHRVARACGALVCAAALANPTGKQNSFAAHGIPELILVEASDVKCPISYANAFLKPVDGDNLMSESAAALQNYINSIASAFAPKNTRRLLLAVGSASNVVEVKEDVSKSKINGADCVFTLEDLVEKVVAYAQKQDRGGGA